MEWPSKTPVPLIRAVQQAVKANRDRLCQQLGVPPHKIYEKLDPVNYDTQLTRDKRKEILEEHHKGARTPLSFLKVLYPLKHQQFMNDARTSDLHRPLINEYFKVKLTSIEPDHLNRFIQVILDNPKFKRPVKLVELGKASSETLVHGYMKQKKYRSWYLRSLNNIFNDLRRHTLPISRQEKDQFLYYNFFRDKKELIRKIRNACYLEGISSPGHDHQNFSYEYYRKVKVSGTPSLNNLLQIARMQLKWEMFDSISRRIITPNRQTFILWLKGYSGPFKHTRRFNIAMAKINVPMDITLLNAKMKGLIKLGRLAEAEELLESLEGPHYKVEDPAYMHLTPESKANYAKYLVYYDNLRRYIDMPPIAIIPNIDTFTPFIQVYALHDEPQKMYNIVKRQQSCGLPLTTRTFKEMFRWRFSWEWSEVFIKLLIDEFERVYSFDPDVNSKIVAPVDGGQLLKLNDRLIASVTRSVSHLHPEILFLYEQLQDNIRDIRRQSHLKDLYIKNEITYLKIRYLHRLHTISTSALATRDGTGWSSGRTADTTGSSSDSLINSSKS